MRSLLRLSVSVPNSLSHTQMQLSRDIGASCDEDVDPSHVRTTLPRLDDSLATRWAENPSDHLDHGNDNTRGMSVCFPDEERLHCLSPSSILPLSERLFTSTSTSSHHLPIKSKSPAGEVDANVEVLDDDDSCNKPGSDNCSAPQISDGAPGRQAIVAKGRLMTGCITCFRRKKMCDETRPQCTYGPCGLGVSRLPPNMMLLCQF